jgi:hypothetical protein
VPSSDVLCCGLLNLVSTRWLKLAVNKYVDVTVDCDIHGCFCEPGGYDVSTGSPYPNFAIQVITIIVIITVSERRIYRLLDTPSPPCNEFYFTFIAPFSYAPYAP